MYRCLVAIALTMTISSSLFAQGAFGQRRSPRNPKPYTLSDGYRQPKPAKQPWDKRQPTYKPSPTKPPKNYWDPEKRKKNPSVYPDNGFGKRYEPKSLLGKSPKRKSG